MRLLRAATLLTPDPDATARRYARWFGYRAVEAGSIAPALAESWGAPAMAGRRYAVVAPASGANVYLRFVAGEIPADYVPLRSFGWGAIELCVQDVRAEFETMQDSPFTIIGPPKALDGAPAIWPMQVQGPDGEIIFLTEIRADEPQARLPRAACAVDCLFIAVLACADIAATRAWFAETLGLDGAPDFELAYTSLSRAFGMPAESRHKIAVLGHDGDAFLQIDQYPAAATRRPMKAGELPPGVSIVSFAIAAAQGGDDRVYGGAPSRVVRTPDGALVEIIG